MSVKEKLFHQTKETQPQLQPRGTKEIVDINLIIIPNDMKESKPRDRKLQKANDFLLEHGYIDKPILIEAITNEKGEPNQLILVDQYTRYLALCSNRYTKAPVKYITI